MIMVQNLSG